MVTTEVMSSYIDTDQKNDFQYQVPRVRGSFTLKVAEDSTAADLPEPTNSYIEIKNPIIKLTRVTLPHSTDNEPAAIQEIPLKDFKPCMPSSASVSNNQAPRSTKPVVANQSSHNIPNDDKDFEIPLEESLKAVEEFIKREKELSKWKIGEDVLAKWKGNGLYYKARILEIFCSGAIIVLFDSYDIQEEIDYKDLCKFFRKTSNFKRKGQVQASNKETAEEKKTTTLITQVKIKKPDTIPYTRLRCVSAYNKLGIFQKRILLARRKKIQKLPLKKIKTKKTTLVEKNKVEKVAF
ncbi:hypothetical protein ABEB36_011414 [Hypothenemus hampei]